MSRRNVTLLAVGLATSATLSAQIRQPGIPATEYAPLPVDVPTIQMATPDIATLMAEDDARGHWPLRYGAVVETQMAFDRVGRWDVTENGAAVWRLRVSSPGAYSLGITFDEFQLPDGAAIFLYDEERTEMHGAYTSANHKPNGMLGIEPVRGDSVVIEYVQPAGVDGEARVSVGEVIHDYRDVLSIISSDGGGVQGGTCLIGINCPEGAPFQTIKRASFRTLSGGSLCSGALLNNTSQDGTPYFLTANHCGGMNNGVFAFNFESGGCAVGSGGISQSVSGATKLAGSGTYDSQLYEMSPVPGSYNPIFAGWDRTGSPTSGPAFSIGHGGGNQKQIAIDANGASPAGNFYNVFWSDGMFVGGNSGGPLYDGNYRVIGPACCVSNFNCGSQTASFGRFNRFWNNSDIGDYLDPGSTGSTQIDALDPNNPNNPPTITSVTPGTIAAIKGGTLQINGTDLFGVTSVQVGTQVLAPGEFTPVNAFLIEILAPLFEDLGSVSVSVTNAVGTSNSVSVTVTDTDPPIICSPPVSVPSIDWKLEWGGQSGDVYFVNWSFDDQTTDLNGFDTLLNANFGLSGTLNAAGTDKFVIENIGSLGFTNLYFQALMFDDVSAAFVGASNVSNTLFL